MSRPKGFSTSEETKRKIAATKTGDKNPHWNGEDASKNAGRARARSHYPNIGACEKCGDEDTERHHKDGNTLNNEPQNISILCRRCHMEEDGRLEQLRLMSAEWSQKGRTKRTANQRAQTHCKRGHLLSGENLHVYHGKRGDTRVCKEYSRAKWRRQDAARKERERNAGMS